MLVSGKNRLYGTWRVNFFAEAENTRLDDGDINFKLTMDIFLYELNHFFQVLS